MTERYGGSDPIERHFSGTVRPSQEVFGPTLFRVWAEGACGAPNPDQLGYEQLLASAADARRVGWLNQPWVTPVVGSGPIGFPDDFAGQAAWLPELLVREMWAAVEAEGRAAELTDKHTGGGDPDDFVRAFVKLLVARRSGVPVGPPLPSDDPPTLAIDASAVWVTVAAAQLTRTFHRMSLDASRPISRWGSEKAEISKQDSRWAELRDEYLPLLTFACEHARDALLARADRLEDPHDGGSSQEVQFLTAARAIAELIAAILANLQTGGSPHVLLVHLEQLTDACWYLLARAVLNDIDPGWTSLLLQLVLTQHEVVATGVVRPRWSDLEVMAVGIRDVYLRATESASRRRRGIEKSGPVTAFYQSLAEVLWAQSDAVSWALRPDATVNGGRQELSWVLPRPLAWVCSFDYEVELALWREAAARRRSAEFAVIMPVYVRQRDSQALGTLVWLEATIAVPRGASEFDAEATVRGALTVASWRLLTNTAGEAGADDHLRHRPVVVHLLGCPVLDLPVFEATSAKDAAPGLSLLAGALAAAGAHVDWRPPAAVGAHAGPGKAALVHAVTVDEVLAVRQTARDWSQGSDTQHQRSLPSDLFRAVGPAKRLYAVLGVPMRDPAVRLRVTSVLARGAQQTNLGRGLVVNQRIDDEELDLMGALGFDLVKARVEKLRESLEGYARWVGEHCASIDRWRAAEAQPGAHETDTLQDAESDSRTTEPLAGPVARWPTEQPQSAVPKKAGGWNQKVGRS